MQNGQGFVIMAGLEEIHNFFVLLTPHSFLVALVSGSWQKLDKVFLNGSLVLQTSLLMQGSAASHLVSTSQRKKPVISLQMMRIVTMSSLTAKKSLK